MKKRNVHNLQLQKSTISSLNMHIITGGYGLTEQDACKDKTVTTCSQFAKCDSKEICSAKCPPIHDAEVPIG